MSTHFLPSSTLPFAFKLSMEFIKQTKQLQQLAEKDVPRLIENIKDELAKIGQTLNRIEYNQRYVTRQTEEEKQ
ncbi:MAG: hypothetical protein QXK78_07170 [Candidatus Bathyarchaeia archaeon]